MISVIYDAYHRMAAHADYEMIGSTNRHTQNETEYQVSAVSGAGGYVMINTSNPHNIVVGDVILLEETTTYDGYHDVTAVTANTITTSTAYSDAAVIVSDTQVTRANRNFKFKFEILNTSGTVLATKYIHPTYGVFESRVAYYKANINMFIDLLTENTPQLISHNYVEGDNGGYLQYYYRVTEIFDDAESLSQTGDDLTVANGTNYYWVYNTYNTSAQMNSSLAFYYYNNWLTNASRNEFNRNSRILIHAFIYYTSFKVKVVRIDSEENPGRDSTESVVTTYITDSFGNTTINTDDSKLMVIPINPTTIDLKQSTISFSVQIISASGTALSDILNFTVTNQPKHTTFAFQNILGGYDTFDFMGIESSNMEIESDVYKSEGVKKRIGVTANESKTYYSDWITETQMDWLKEMLYSKHIFRLDGTTWTRVNIVNENVNTYKVGELTQLNVTFEDPEINHN